MHLVQDVMSSSVAHVTRDTPVRVAVELMLSHQLDVLPVVAGGEVVGLLDALRAGLYDGDVPCGEVSDPALALEAGLPVAEAAHRLRSAGRHSAPVVAEGRLVGHVTARDLLTVWGSVSDALTALPVQHQLRRWLSTQLAAGREVAVLFLDLDDFGAVNKRYGHVAGDRVLRQVAAAIRAETDAVLDYPCRYGGDEFAVGTLRRGPELRELAVRLRDAVRSAPFEDPPGSVSVSIGLAGGRRAQQRPGIHPAATLDDLLNRASTASTAAKQLPEHIFVRDGDGAPGEKPGSAVVPDSPAGPPCSVPPRVVVETCTVTRAGGTAQVTVALRRGEETHRFTARGPESALLRNLTRATTRCLQRLCATALEVEETYEYQTPAGIPCVGATVTLELAGATERLIGAVPVRDDPYRAYLAAVLDAANRRLGLG